VTSKPISLAFIAEVAQYLRETKKVEVSTDDIADALVAVTNSSDDLERKLSRAMRGAEQDTERLERAIRDLPKATDDAADKAGKDFRRIGDEAKEGFGETGKEAGSEFASNLAEGLSSGDLGSVARDTAFGLLTAFQSVPIAGQVAIGLAAAATAAYTIITGQSKAAAAEIQTIFDAFVEEGGAAVRRMVQQSGLEKLGGTVAQGWKDAAKAADSMGLEVEDLVSLYDGDLLPVEQQLFDLMKKDYDLLLDKVGHGETLTTQEADRLKILNEQIPLIQGQVDKYSDAAEAAGLAVDAAGKPINQSNVIAYGDIIDGIKGDAEGVGPALGAGDVGLPQTRADAEAIASALARIPSVVNVAMKLNYSGLSASEAADLRARGIYVPKDGPP
jgi:hypothetical protein